MGKKKKRNSKQPKPQPKPFDPLESTTEQIEATEARLAECQRRVADIQGSLETVANLEPLALWVASMMIATINNQISSVEQNLLMTHNAFQSLTSADT